MQIPHFRIPEDVASVNTQRLASGLRIDFAEAVDVVTEHFLEEPLALVSSVLGDMSFSCLLLER